MKNHGKKELEKMEELRKIVEASPLTQKIRADEAAEILAKRKKAIRAIEALRKEQAVNLPKLQADLKAKEEKYLTAKAMLDKASDEVRTARAMLSSEGNQFDIAIRNQEAILFESADPKIDETITFFRDKLDYLRKPGRITRTGRKSEKNLISWEKKTLSESNVQAVHDAIEYCRNAIEELDRMKLIPELNLQKIEELKNRIPAIDIYSEFTGTKPMERQAPTIVPPCEFTFKKLLEKVDKHLKTPAKKARI